MTIVYANRTWLASPVAVVVASLTTGRNWHYTTVAITVNGTLVHEPASLDQRHARGCVVGLAASAGTVVLGGWGNFAAAVPQRGDPEGEG